MRMDNIRRAGIQDMLAARDARAARQQALIARHRAPLISFTMNIAGDVKCDPLILRAFYEGAARVRRELARMGAAVLEEEESVSFTGCEMRWAVSADAGALKDRMCLIEEIDALGRLFDLDVIDAAGSHLSRSAERRCLICGAPVRACARSRAHSTQELYQRAHEIIKAHFQEEFIRSTGEMAQRALLYEAITTPRPGLVDCEDSGAHSDMDLFSFMDSACALRPYFESCVRMGAEGADETHLQFAGMLAEDRMLAAAHANTHKGAIFSLGILCHAAGSCGEGASLDAILKKAAQTGSVYLRQMQQTRPDKTGGEQQYLRYGLTGARGEAASGFASAVDIGLPALRKALSLGRTFNDAAASALLHLMARVQDSNVLRRSGMEGQHLMMQEACCALESGVADLRAMNNLFKEKNISPGGCADLLAVTCFLYFWSSRSGEA